MKYEASHNKIILTDDWVMDTYGLVLTKKLMDRAENDGFLLPPTDAHGTLATVKVNDDKVVRLKFVPASFRSNQGKKGKLKKTTNLISESM